MRAALCALFPWTTLFSGARIWYAVDPPPKGSKQRGIAWLERVATGHQNQTLTNHR
jgi:hypothetical protein